MANAPKKTAELEISTRASRHTATTFIRQPTLVERDRTANKTVALRLICLPPGDSAFTTCPPSSRIASCRTTSVSRVCRRSSSAKSARIYRSGIICLPPRETGSSTATKLGSTCRRISASTSSERCCRNGSRCRQTANRQSPIACTLFKA